MTLGFQEQPGWTMFRSSPFFRPLIRPKGARLKSPIYQIPSPDFFPAWINLNIPLALDFTRTKISITSIFQEPNGNVGIPISDAGHAFPRQVHVKHVTGNYDTSIFIASQSAHVQLWRSHIVLLWLPTSNPKPFPSPISQRRLECSNLCFLHCPVQPSLRMILSHDTICQPIARFPETRNSFFY
jgi:hypothetical protein